MEASSTFDAQAILNRLRGGQSGVSGGGGSISSGNSNNNYNNNNSSNMGGNNSYYGGGGNNPSISPNGGGGYGNNFGPNGINNSNYSSSNSNNNSSAPSPVWNNNSNNNTNNNNQGNYRGAAPVNAAQIPNQNFSGSANQVPNSSSVVNKVPVTYLTPNQRKEMADMRAELEVENEKLSKQLRQSQADNKKLAEEKKKAEDDLKANKAKSDETIVQLRKKIAQLKEVLADIQHAHEKKSMALTSLGVIGTLAPKFPPNMAASSSRPQSSGNNNRSFSAEDLNSGSPDVSHFKEPTVSELMRRSTEKDPHPLQNQLRKPKGPNPAANFQSPQLMSSSGSNSFIPASSGGNFNLNGSSNAALSYSNGSAMSSHLQSQWAAQSPAAVNSSLNASNNNNSSSNNQHNNNYNTNYRNNSVASTSNPGYSSSGSDKRYSAASTTQFGGGGNGFNGCDNGDDDDYSEDDDANIPTINIEL